MISKILLILVLFFNLSYSNENFNFINTNEIYFLPNEKNLVKDKIEALIGNSKEEIIIAMYNFSYKKFAKALVKSSKKGINITVLLDSEKIKKDDKIYKYFKNNGIKTIISNKKMHLKTAVFDRKEAIIGSLNWTKESFNENNEVILFTKDKKVILKLINFINSI